MAIDKKIEAEVMHAVDFIVSSSERIVIAHTDLGLPLEDVLCAAVRTALSRRVVDERQRSLFPDGRQHGS